MRLFDLSDITKPMAFIGRWISTFATAYREMNQATLTGEYFVVAWSGKYVGVVCLERVILHGPFDRFLEIVQFDFALSFLFHHRL